VHPNITICWPWLAPTADPQPRPLTGRDVRGRFKQNQSTQNRVCAPTRGRLAPSTHTGTLAPWTCDETWVNYTVARCSFFASKEAADDRPQVVQKQMAQSRWITTTESDPENVASEASSEMANCPVGIVVVAPAVPKAEPNVIVRIDAVATFRAVPELAQPPSGRVSFERETVHRTTDTRELQRRVVARLGSLPSALSHQVHHGATHAREQPEPVPTRGKPERQHLDATDGHPVQREVPTLAVVLRHGPIAGKAVVVRDKTGVTQQLLELFARGTVRAAHEGGSQEAAG